MQLPPTTAPAALVAPFVRAWGLSGDEAASGVLFGALAFVFDPIYWLGVGLLVVVSVWDWLLGTRAALRRKEYDGSRALNGLISKATGVVLIFALRGLVEYLRASGLPMPADMTVQAAGATLTAIFIVSEIRSIGEKQVEFGSRTLAPVIRFLDRIIGIDRKEVE